MHRFHLRQFNHLGVSESWLPYFIRYIMVFRKKKTVNYLELKPIRVIQTTTETNGKVTLLVPKFKNESLRKFMVPARKSPFIRVHLDEMGSEVWRLIDDTSTVESICFILRSKMNEKALPTIQIEERVTTYLSELYKSRFIKFM